MNGLLASTIIAATLAISPTGRNVDVAVVYEDVRVIRRVATAAGKDMPEKVLKQLIDENVERLRGRVDERNYLFAKWTRTEESRVKDTKTVKKEKDGRSTIVEVSAPLAYRLEIGAPSRRYLAARNRPLQLESVIVEYVNAAGLRKTEQFDLGRAVSPGESTHVDLAEIGWNVTARLKARAEESAGGHGTVEMILISPTLVDDLSSPFAGPTANLLALRKAVSNKDILEIRRICDATTAWFDEMSGPGRSPRGVSRPSSIGSAGNERFHGELQEIQDLLTGDEQQRLDGLKKLHQLIVRLRP